MFINSPELKGAIEYDSDKINNSDYTNNFLSIKYEGLYTGKSSIAQSAWTFTVKYANH